MRFARKNLFHTEVFEFYSSKFANKKKSKESSGTPCFIVDLGNSIVKMPHVGGMKNPRKRGCFVVLPGRVIGEEEVDDAQTENCAVPGLGGTAARF